jgi:hypothetical protein
MAENDRVSRFDQEPQSAGWMIAGCFVLNRTVFEHPLPAAGDGARAPVETAGYASSRDRPAESCVRVHSVVVKSMRSARRCHSPHRGANPAEKEA